MGWGALSPPLFHHIVLEDEEGQTTFGKGVTALHLPVVSVRESKVYESVKSYRNDVPKIKKYSGCKGGGERGRKAAVSVCGARESKSPDDSCKSSSDERKSLRGRKSMQSNAMNTHLTHLLCGLNISAQYISSAALTGLLTLSVSVCTSVHAMTTKLSTHQLTAPFSANASLHQLSKAFA